MTTDIVLAGLLPGWSMRGRRRPLALALLAVGVALPVVFVLSIIATGRNWVALTLDTTFLGWIVAVGLLAWSARLVAVVECWWDAGRPRRLAPFEAITAGLVAVALGLGLFGVVEVGRARAAIAPAFVVSDGVLFDADEPTPTGAGAVTPTTPPTISSSPASTTTIPVLGAPGVVRDVPALATTTTTLPPLPTRPDSGVSAEALADVTNVLLIGADSGPGRSGLRTDAMMLFSLHAPSGRASLISIPRNLERMLLPPGSALEARYPYGYRGMANAIYIEVTSRRTLRDQYRVDGVRPGVVALAQAVGYSLDVTIHDYVLVDMQGFLELIDALGGVTVRLTRSVPMPGNVPGAPTQYPDRIGPGVVEMDGTTALGYVRSRKDDNDYRRAGRQRDLLAALATQVSWSDVATSFGDVAAAVGGTLSTSLTPDELADTLSVIGGETAIVESVGLVPPLVRVTRPDFQEMAEIVGAVRLALVTGQPSGY
ncbi:MAG: LCP family protein [Ilumatobacter sp.]|nr:LCP family protein [Ilumatobacter sp.]